MCWINVSFITSWVSNTLCPDKQLSCRIRFIESSFPNKQADNFDNMILRFELEQWGTTKSADLGIFLQHSSSNVSLPFVALSHSSTNYPLTLKQIILPSKINDLHSAVPTKSSTSRCVSRTIWYESPMKSFWQLNSCWFSKLVKIRLFWWPAKSGLFPTTCFWPEWVTFWAQQC